MKLIDLHCDTLYDICMHGGDLANRSGHIDLARAQHYDHYAQVFALFCGAQPLEDPAEARQLLDRLLSTAQEQLSAHEAQMMLCTSGTQLEKARAEHKTAAILSIEGAELLPDFNSLRKAYDAGVRIVTLSWNHRSGYACGASTDNDAGLTGAGRDFVRRCEELGIVLDVSHLSERGFWELCELTDRPLLATHSNCRSICPHLRNLTDAQIKELVRRDGRIGLNLYVPFLTTRERASSDDVLRHLEHLLQLGAEHHICLGVDFDGCDRLPDDLNDLSEMNTLHRRIAAQFSLKLADAVFYRSAEQFIHKYIM